MVKERKPSFNEVAYHEAGHAVVAHYYRRAVFEISMQADKYVSGWMVNARRPPVGKRMDGISKLSQLWPHAVEELLVECTILMAGGVAEGGYLRIPLGQVEGAQADFESLVQEMRAMEVLQREIPEFQQMLPLNRERLLHSAIARANRIMTHHSGWLFVERIVGALIARPHLGQESLKRILADMRQDSGQLPSDRAPLNYQMAMDL
ncbi:hypothetical protein D0544_03775 [Aestuariirhabdus litorea]|uniref:Peptidase M41 domain-containing protein n=2 Tax=Aestuariirhabdus litorea TaxID=2528527 RepID=A0A3P3VRV4_9GAMM|nr:hypothetical protein D0544_03775 [Aestuariirhabdus litorea]